MVDMPEEQTITTGQEIEHKLLSMPLFFSQHICKETAVFKVEGKALSEISGDS